MKRFFQYLVLAPVIAGVIVFAYINRHLTALSFNPLDPQGVIEVPLFLLLLAMMIIGALCGAGIVWLKQGRYRRAAREARQMVERQTGELQALREQINGSHSVTAGQTAALPSVAPL